MREWVIESKLATVKELDKIEQEASDAAKQARKNGWNAFKDPIRKERDALVKIIDNRSCVCKREHVDKVGNITKDLKKIINPVRKDVVSSARKILRSVCNDCSIRKDLQIDLGNWLERNKQDNAERYNSFIYNDTDYSALKVKPEPPVITANSEEVPGRQVLRENFDHIFSHNPLVVTFGEDVGHIGGVNQSLEGLQEKYGELRISDTGIRENTILGQGIGLALRGLRPITEIQYFDYLLYALQTMSDDLATTLYRTRGNMNAPVIIRTRGHRLEGIWHSGSPLSMVINSIRGIYVCVPRNMTQAAGFYNTLLEANDTALVIEPLNGYRLKEKKPENIGSYKTPLGKPEILQEGTDISLVTYGSCVRIAQDAIEQLKDFGISVELIDVQTLLPYDLDNMILESVKKTNKILFFDEDVPGGATAFMMQKVLEEQGAFYYLDAEPRTLSAHEHRPAYATDGDYFSNPNAEDVFDIVYEMMHEHKPEKHPELF